MTYLNFAKNILLSNFKRLNRPFKLTFALTYRCNSRCKICQIWKKKPRGELKFKEIKNFFILNDYFNWIDLTGGEIFLRKDLLQIIEVIFQTQKNLFLFHVPTNGILTEKITRDVEKILNFNPKRFFVSIALDGPPEVHDRLRGLKGNWRKAVETYKNLKRFNSKNFNCLFGMTLSGNNFNLIEKAYQVLKKEIPNLNRHDLHFNLAHYSPHYYQNRNLNLDLKTEIGGRLERFNRRKGFLVSGASFLEKKYQKRIPLYLKTRQTPLPCQSLSASVFIAPKGNIYPCSIWNEKIGNLMEIDYNFNEIWKRERTLVLRKRIVEHNCPNCWTPCEAYQTILGNLLQSFHLSG